MEYVGEEQMVEQDGDNDGGWVETHHFDESTSGINEKICEMTLDSSKVCSSLLIFLICFVMFILYR